MVQAVENWARLRGRVVRLEDEAAHAGRPDGSRLVVHVTAVEPADGYPNLLAWAVGQEVAVRLPAARLAALALAPDDLVRARVRVAGPGVVIADPDTVARD